MVAHGGGETDKKIESTLETQIPQVAAVDRATLTPLVQRALKRKNVELVDWEYQQLHAGAGEGSAVYRFSGQGDDQGQAVPWSLILKTLQPQDLDCEPSAWNYCKREMDAYQSGWLDDLPGGLAAPRNFGVIEYPDGTCWIWLEDIQDVIGAHWPLEQYGVVARHVGQFNGAYLCGKPQPNYPWLSSGWLRCYIAQSAPWIGPLREMLDHSDDFPLIRHWFPGDSSDKFFSLWEDHNCFFDILDHLPQTICHLDVFRRNLFAQKKANGDDQTVAVDWAFAGRGAIGEELVPLVQASVGFNEVDLSQAQDLEEIVLDGYLQGLHDVGWQGDPRQVRLGYTAASIRYRFAEIWRGLEIIQDEAQQDWLAQTLGCPIEQVFDSFAQVGSFAEGRADEARELMDVLDLSNSAAR